MPNNKGRDHADLTGLSLPGMVADHDLVGRQLIQWVQKVNFDKSDEPDVGFLKRKPSAKDHNNGTVTESVGKFRKGIEYYQARTLPTGTFTEDPQAVPYGHAAFAQRLAGIFGN